MKVNRFFVFLVVVGVVNGCDVTARNDQIGEVK